MDLIITATGYNWDLPYLSQELFNWRNDRPEAYLKIFNTKEPTLFLNGYIETNSGAYKLFDEMGMLIAKTIEAQRDDGQLASDILTHIRGPEPDLGGKIRYVQSARHTGYTNVDAYKKAMAGMARTFKWPTASVFFAKLRPVLPGQDKTKQAA